MRRILTLGVCLALLCTPAAMAADASQTLWSRSEGDGSYVTIRVPYLQGESAQTWSEQETLSVRYADSKEPVALTSRYLQGYLFATVPASEAKRPLEVFRGEEFRFSDLVQEWDGHEYYDAPIGADELYLRGVIQGDQNGNLNADASLTRAEAFAMICRLLSLKPGGDPHFADVTGGDWYYDTASAARAAGIAAADQNFYPNRPVNRGEITTMLARAMGTIGWLESQKGTASDLELVDAEKIPQWALEGYLAFAPNSIGILTSRDTEEIAEDGVPQEELFAEWDKAATRGDVITFLYNALRSLPVYPNETAVAWAFDKAMPVIDGSTSTHPYTTALYSMLFHNYDNHPQYPLTHSKSHESYERLISGQVDVLFAATKASTELEAQAKAAGVELEYIPIAYDAMVFFTNAENSITGLTKKQIQEIYVGNQYTNWNQVGGPNAALLPYRRNTDSGSHALMEQYFLEGGKLSLSPDVNNVYTSYAMTSALTDVAAALVTEPPAYAMGYSVYYFYLNSYWLLDDAGGRELKLLAVDGVAPSDATIADGSYPLAGYNYAVVRAGEPTGSLARTLIQFMLSDAGQECVASAGFGPLSGSAAADFAKTLPDWDLAKISPLDVGYVALSWNRDHTIQRASYLERTGSTWSEITGVECPIAKDGGLASAVLGTRNHTLVFGNISSQLQGVEKVQFIEEGGRTQVCTATPGDVFSFVLDRDQKPQGIEVLRGAQAPIRYNVGT